MYPYDVCTLVVYVCVPMICTLLVIYTLMIDLIASMTGANVTTVVRVCLHHLLFNSMYPCYMCPSFYQYAPLWYVLCTL